MSHCWQEHTFSHGLRYAVFVFLKSKWAGHSAATGIDGLQVRPRFSQEGLFIANAHNRFVMAMSMQQNFSGDLRRRVSGGMAFQEFAEQECLGAQSYGASVVRKQIAQFIAEYGSATRFQNDQRHSRHDVFS